MLKYNGGVIDSKVAEKYDNIFTAFMPAIKENDIDMSKDDIEEIIDAGSKFTLKIKYKYNRPRPYQIADHYGIEDFKRHKLDTANTPSYPSGHTIQGHLMAELLGREYPKHWSKFKDLADFVSKSRIMARAHYPSDVKFGEEVAQHILGKVIQGVKND